MWVVKLGGSLAYSPALEDWLQVLAREGAGRALIVPGGGPFADQVRSASRHWRLAEPVGHRMALLAMEQYGRMLAGLCPALTLVETPADIVQARARGGASVWLPVAMTAGREEIEESWALTSDSLAAWLAAELGAAQLVLVKSLAPPAGPVRAAELSRRGIVDPRFPRYAGGGSYAAWWMGSGQHARMAQALAGSAEPGTRIVTDRQEEESP